MDRSCQGKLTIVPMQNHSWDLLRDFLSVYRAGSVTGAAKILGVQQSTVSRRLAELEEMLDVQLFFRLQSGVEPTAAAHALVRDAEDAERSIANLHLKAENTSEEVAGLVRLAAPFGIAVQVVLPALAALYEQHPHLQIDVLTGLETVDLSRREADIALRFVKPVSGDLMAKPIADLEFAVVASKSYRKRTRTRSVNKLDWIGLDVQQSASPEFAWMQANVTRTPRLLSNDYDLQIEAVRRGLGVALVPRAVCNVWPDLVVVNLGLPMPPPMRLWLVMHRHLRRVSKYARVWSGLQEASTRLTSKPTS